jgi:hypothetical protein
METITMLPHYHDPLPLIHLVTEADWYNFFWIFLAIAWNNLVFSSPNFTRRMVDLLLVFFAPARYRVVKIAHSSFEVVLRTTKHMIYPGSGPSLEVIALCPAVWYWRWTCVTRDEQRAWEIHVVKGEMDLIPLPEG